MGYSGHKTYKAPDGTLYQVEEDGTLKKISNLTEEKVTMSSKYQITDAGEVYRIEDDGSVTYVTNIDYVNNLPIQISEQTIVRKSKKTKAWKWIIGLIILVICVCLYFVFGVKRGLPYATTAKLTLEQDREETALDIEEGASEQIVEILPTFNEVREYKSDIDEDHIFLYVFYPDGICGRYDCDLEYTTINIGTYSRINSEVVIEFKGEPKTILNYDDNKLWYSNCEMKRNSHMESPEITVKHLTSEGIEYHGYDKDNNEYKFKFYKHDNRNKYSYSKISHYENGGIDSTSYVNLEGIFDVKDKILHLQSGMEKDIYLINPQGFVMDDIYFFSIYVIND